MSFNFNGQEFLEYVCVADLWLTGYLHPGPLAHIIVDIADAR